jgi:hypothetical protein
MAFLKFSILNLDRPLSQMSETSTPTNSPKLRSQEITLSALGLEQTSTLEPDSFVFVVGDSQYWCTRFQAVFFSKTICDMFLSDPLIDEYVIDDIPDPNHNWVWKT